MLLPADLPFAAKALIALSLAASLSLVSGRYVIGWLTSRGMQDGEGRKAAQKLNELNAGKARTPTMGGLFIMLSLLVSSLVVLPPGPVVWAVLGATLLTACLGAVDDWAKLRRKKGDGLRGRTKIVVQASAAALAAWVLAAELGNAADAIQIPGLALEIPLAGLFIPWAVMVTVGSSNAVNLSDGLDGLAGGMMVAALVAFAAVGWAVGSPEISAALGVTHVPAAADLALLALVAAGAVLGFLWYNVHPAQVFMGDTGSLALGTLLGMLALAMRQEVLLALVGGVFVAEAVSVMMQVGWFKLTKGKRIFRCAPLHHHFQYGGMSEVKVTLRFWIVAGVLAVAGLAVFSWPAMAGGGGNSEVSVAGDSAAGAMPDSQGNDMVMHGTR